MKKYKFSVIYFIYNEEDEIKKVIDVMYGSGHQSVVDEIKKLENFVTMVYIGVIE